MAVQYGKCTNRAGCTLAYTGDQIRFEGAPICPECGQPLAVIKGPGGGKGKLWLLILLPILLIGMVAAGYFIVQAMLGLAGSDGKASPTATATVSATATATPSASATPTTEQIASASPSPTGSPSPPTAGPSASASGSVDTNPKQLSSSDIEATRKQVLVRLRAMPGKSDQEKAKLEDKIQSAKSMERLSPVIYFPIGSSMIPKPQADQVVSIFSDSKMKEKMSDPTLVFVVAGYADKSGNPQGNQALSNARAENVSRLMKQAGVTNVIHTVAMGGTDVLENTRPDQNRAVEIWAVIP
jgi:outer membrane protein OmpA-like peptidoglycan-associated protein